MSDTEPSVAAPMFTITVEPIPLDPAFSQTLAAIVIEWSRFEAAIGLDTSDMVAYPIVKALAPEPPRMFHKKIAFWKRAVDTLFRSVPQYRELAAAIKTRAIKAAKLRNHLVHGTWDLEGPDETGAWTVSNMQHFHVVTKWERMKVRQEGLDDLLAEIMDLSGMISGFQATKMMHAHYGLLRPAPAPSPEHPAPQTPPTDATP